MEQQPGCVDPVGSPAVLRSLYGTLGHRTTASVITIVPTTRDLDVLIALDRCPLTVAQLLKLSETFTLPFTTTRRVQERLSLLAERGFVHRWQYAVPGQGTMNYYTLSKDGYRLLHGPGTTLPGHRAFEPLSASRLMHTQALADFIVHTAVAAHRGGFTMTDFHREGSLRLHVVVDYLYPDCAFQLTAPEGTKFAFYGELDNGTEPVRTEYGRGAFERKIRFYEAYKDQCKVRGLDHRFRVALVTTGTTKRLVHLLHRTEELLRLKRRPLAFGVTLADYLACKAPLTSECFTDNCGTPRVLIPPGRTARSPTAAAAVEALARVGTL